MVNSFNAGCISRNSLILLLLFLSQLVCGANLIDGKGEGIILKRSLLPQLPKTAPATTYIVRSTLNLHGETLEMPSGSKLLFEKGKIKNGRVVFHDNELQGKVKIYGEITGTVVNDVVFMDWFTKPVSNLRKLKNTTDRIQAIFNLGAQRVVFGEGYYQFNNVSIGKKVEVYGEGTKIIPVVLEQNEYDFNFLKNVFYTTDAEEIIIKGITFEGKKTGNILPDFKSTTAFGEPLIWVNKAKKVEIDGCVFKDIENCTYCNKAYNYYGKKQGSCVCLWDVNDASFINCEQIGNRHDEQVWIIAVNKPIMETKVTYSGNFVHDMTPGPNSSAFTCVAGNCIMENNRVDRYSYPGSMFNVFAKKAIVRNNEIKNSYCSSVFDFCEYSYFHNDDVLVENNQVDAINSVLVLGQTAKMTIKNNTFSGLGLYYSANSRRPKNSSGGYKYWYTKADGVLPTDVETIIEGNNCDFTAYDGNRSFAGIKVDYGTGEILESAKYNNVGVNYGCGILIHPEESKAGSVIISNNTFASIQSLEGAVDKNNLAGVYPYTIKLVNTDCVVIRGNTFNGCYPVYQNPNEVTCISVYNYPDIMEKLDKPSSISLKPSEYGKYVIEDNVFNVFSDKSFYPVCFNPRVNAFRQTELVIRELVVRNNRIEGVNTKAHGGLLINGRFVYKQSGPVKVLKETVR